MGVIPVVMRVFPEIMSVIPVVMRVIPVSMGVIAVMMGVIPVFLPHTLLHHLIEQPLQPRVGAGTASLIKGTVRHQFSCIFSKESSKLY